ncbi:MAG: hypothetical protein ABIW47_15420 [Ginsengibacter sp.]|jgi:hypothetical protein
MKKYLLLIFALCSFLMVNAQKRGGGESDKIQALKIAFITQKLDLSASEAQIFWPVYNQYDDEVKNLKRTNNGDVIERDEKLLNIRKKYKVQFEKILGADRANKLYNVEGEFRSVLIKQLKNKGNNQ